MTATATRELAIQDYIDILRRRWKIIVAILLLAAAGAAAATLLQETTYEARAEVLIRNGSTNQLFPSAPATGNRLVRQSQAEITFLRTDTYREAAAEELGRSADVEISLVNDANVTDSGRISFVSVDTVAERAAEAAQAYAQAYLDARNRADVEDIQRQLDEASSQQANYTAELAALREPIDELDRVIAQTNDPTLLESLRVQRTLLTSQLGADVGRVQSNLSQTELTVEQLTEARSIITDQDMTAIISRAAQVPTSPVSTGWVQNLLIALAVGAVLGVAAALLRESLDNHVHSDDDITSLLDLPVLGHVGKMSKKESVIGLVVNQKEPNIATLEAYRKIRSSVMFMQAEREINVIQVTSPVEGNGKTTVASNLAVAFAQQRQSVLIIDADLRRPQVHKRFLVTGLDRGLSELLAEELPFPDALRLDSETGVHVLPAGARPDNPSELLGSEAFEWLYKVARSEFDIIIIDTPPVLPVPDSRLVASVADAVILVVDPSTNSKRELTDSAALLNQAGAKIAGVVLNRAPDDRGYGHSYGYAYEEQ